MTKESIALLLVGHLPAVAGARTEGAKYVSADCRPLDWGSLATAPSDTIRCRRHCLSIQGLMSSSHSVTDRRVVCVCTCSITKFFQELYTFEIHSRQLVKHGRASFSSLYSLSKLTVKGHLTQHCDTSGVSGLAPESLLHSIGYPSIH